LPYKFIMTGGGTGGHVFPALAVARVLRERGHELLFIGTQEGMESRLVPEDGFNMAFVRVGGLNRVGLRKQMRTAFQLPGGIAIAWGILKRFRPDAVFSTGGFVAGPVSLAAIFSNTPLIVLEPNAIPGFANRRVARRVHKALLGFPSTAAWFPPAKSEVIGYPVRPEFFSLRPGQNRVFTVLITGGSRGARSLNRAVRESWPLFQRAKSPVRIIHQTGVAEHESLASEFAATGLNGEVVPFIRDMVTAFGNADLVVGRSGAGAVSEIAAAGMPSVLVPLPFAADDHQRRNAETFVNAGAARMLLDSDLSGTRLFEAVEGLRNDQDELRHMRERVRQFAKPGAAERGATVLEEIAAQRRMPKLR
jgi:UDP-N-acetylglucosamine--N-acetylmuramyl-(pentapeptide) pyrophosphoryl-undecaprenol N-acetylglucosamine transferase